MTRAVFILTLIMFLFSCEYSNNKLKRKRPESNSYRFEDPNKWLAKYAKDTALLRIILAVNKTDSSHFAQMDSVIAPVDISGDIAYYLPFPLSISYLKKINKIIFFSYATQTFATYEKGELIYTGPTNMGRKKDVTPTGLFFANWKAKETTSTFNDEWNLRWNFNIANKEGIGWHQYDMPGYPSSHSCLRLLEKDAQYLYNWADQWILDEKDNIIVNGTPIIIFGNYDFDAPRPWLQLVANPRYLDITKAELQNQTKPYLNKILFEQRKRETFYSGSKELQHPVAGAYRVNRYIQIAAR